MRPPTFAVDLGTLRRVQSPEFANTMYLLGVEMRAREYPFGAVVATFEMVIRQEVAVHADSPGLAAWVSEAADELLLRVPDTGTAWKFLDLDAVTISGEVIRIRQER